MTATETDARHATRSPPPSSRSAVGEGLQRLLRSVGVHEVVAGGQSMNPSTAQILEAVDRAPAEAVVVLPNNKNIVAVAQQVDDLTEREVGVVPTHSVVEALAALVVYDPDATLADNAAAMADAASRVRAGEVTQAVRDSVAECGPIAKGDWIAVDARRDLRRGAVAQPRRRSGWSTSWSTTTASSSRCSLGADARASDADEAA